MSGPDESWIERARRLPDPVDYFAGLDWDGLLLPRNLLCFSRCEQSHEVGGWEGISTRSGRYDRHSRFVLLLPLRGRGEVGVETEVWPMAEGAAMLMFPHQVHYYLELPERFCWLFVSFELDAAGAETIAGLRNQPRRAGPEIEMKLRAFLKNYESATEAADAFELGRLLGEILSKLLDAPALEPGSVGDDLVRRVRRHVFKELDGDLSVEGIAALIGCSGSYLRDRFRNEGGVSLGHFVRSVRLVQATHALRDGGEGVREIAARCGFRSFTSFSRAFTRDYGMSPTDYRKRHRGELRGNG